jgi:hypothetical protein
VTLSPSAGSTSSRRLSPGCGGLCIWVMVVSDSLDSQPALHPCFEK